MEAEEPDQGQVQNIPARQTQQPPPQQPTRQTAPGINAPEVSNGVVSAEQIDVDLAFIFGGAGAIARGASAARGIPHMTTPEGMLHTFHLYGDTSGEKITTVFLPEGFINATYEGGSNNQVSAENEETGEILVLAHVAGISSQRDLDKNLNSGVINGAGSRLVGPIGGPGGIAPVTITFMVRFIGTRGAGKIFVAKRDRTVGSPLKTSAAMETWRELCLKSSGSDEFTAETKTSEFPVRSRIKFAKVERDYACSQHFLEETVTPVVVHYLHAVLDRGGKS